MRLGGLSAALRRALFLQPGLFRGAQSSGEARLVRPWLIRFEWVRRAGGGVRAVQFFAQVELLLRAVEHAFTPVNLPKFEVQCGSVRRQGDGPFQFGLRLGQILLSLVYMT